MPSNRAGTYWHHPHPHELTAKQAYLDQASLFVVQDDEELALQKALDLTLGVTDIARFQDKKFDGGGRAPSEEDEVNGFLSSTAGWILLRTYGKYGLGRLSRLAACAAITTM
jgi:FtsP/CotA-like multicopper oxidase with cupredoxin domain